MHIETQGLDLAGGQMNVRLDQTPDICPRCHRSVHPKLVVVAVLREPQLAQGVFRCTHLRCQELFLGTYDAAGTVNSRHGYSLKSVTPMRPVAREFPDLVAEVSPTFVTIHTQATHAESLQLDQLVGIGLRKALEFLIKDFASATHPDRQESIRKTPLAQCIDNFIADPNVKECAKRATWLGNDETHYTRKWETKDISDMKILVRLTVNWIENVLLTRKYSSEMPPPGGA